MYTTIKWNLLAVCLCLAANVMAQEDPLLSPLKGDDTIRTAKSPSKGDLEGLDIGMELTTEVQATTSGDMNFVNLLRLNATVPLSQKLTVEAASLSTCMTAAESIGGDLQTFSNLDAGNILFALSLFDVEWQINEHNTLYAGIRNMNEDYFTSPVTSLFTNSSCGIFPTISANYPIANYPVASVGVHYRYEKAIGSSSLGTSTEGDMGKVSVQASVYNGVGYNRFSGRENVFRVCPKSDGVFGIAQIDYQRGGSSFFLGACGHYGKNDMGKRNFGSSLWAYTEQRISSKTSIIADYSHAFAPSYCSDFIDIGALYSLQKCELGVFTDYARFKEKSEYATELTCKISINQHIQIQPTVHLISTDSAFRSAAMLRSVVVF